MNKLNIIVKIKDKYCIWSTIFKRPTTYLMNIDELMTYIEDVEGEESEDSIGIRLNRVDTKGVSVKSLEKEDLISNNKAGQDKEYIDEDTIYEQYQVGYNNKHLIIVVENKLNKEDKDEYSYAINKYWYISNSASLFMLFISFLTLIGMFFVDKYHLNERFMIFGVAIFFYFVGVLSSAKMKIWKRRTK